MQQGSAKRGETIERSTGKVLFIFDLQNLRPRFMENRFFTQPFIYEGDRKSSQISGRSARIGQGES